ncbi:hypothetical protein HUJ05_010599 [Dendroctonus ponderosae]|nr:hypothetical protein HUJ05_010599 [Dendroctonus ponderosae]
MFEICIPLDGVKLVIISMNGNWKEMEKCASFDYLRIAKIKNRFPKATIYSIFFDQHTFPDISRRSCIVVTIY